jgi:hypothetical protein
MFITKGYGYKMGACIEMAVNGIGRKEVVEKLF